MKKKLIFLIVSFLIAISLFFSLKKCFGEKNDIELKIDLKLEKDIIFQTFFTQSKDINFNEKDSLRQKIKGNSHFQKISVDLKNVNKLEKLRLDFGEYPGEVYIKSIKIQGEKKINIKLSDMLRFRKNQIEELSLDNNILKIKSNLVDPYIILEDNLVSNTQSIRFNYLESFTFLLLSSLIFYRLLVYIDRKKEKLSWDKIIYMTIFFLIILFPVLKIDNKEIEEVENRNLAKKSKLIKNNTLNINFGKETEAWLNDHFFKRRKVIDFYKKINIKLLGRIENERALMGKNNWIFYKGDNSIENFQNAKLFLENELKNIESNLKEREKWLNDRNIKYYTFVAPDKNKIYGENFPSYINKIKSTGRAYQLRKYLKDKNIKIIYPYEELMGEKKNGLLYWKTDTHWNSHGAYIGYQKLISEIKKDFPNIQEVKEDDLKEEKSPYLKGDLLNMLGVNEERYKDTYYKNFILKNRSFEYTKNEGRNGVITKNNKPLKVLVFRDSFTSSLVPYLSETFGDVEYIWNHNFNNFQEKIEKYNPDIVIHEMVERYVTNLKNNSPKLKGGK